MGVYTTTSSVQNYTNVGTDEFSVTALQDLITKATNQIDLLTNKTWQAVSTSTNEYYDGNGTNELKLDHPDLVAVTALSIDDNNDGIFTTITPSYVKLLPNGRIYLDSATYPAIEVTDFTNGKQNVKVTYTYGTTTVPSTVEYLCVLIVAQMMHMEGVRQDEIDLLIGKLKSDRTDQI